MANDPSSNEIDDMYAATAALIWDRLPVEARRGVQRELSADDRNEVAQAIRHGRRVIRNHNQ